MMNELLKRIRTYKTLSHLILIVVYLEKESIEIYVNLPLKKSLYDHLIASSSYGIIYRWTR